MKDIKTKTIKNSTICYFTIVVLFSVLRILSSTDIFNSLGGISKYILNALFIEKLGIAAITLSTSLVTLFNATLLGCILLKRINLDYKIYFVNLAKMVLAAFLSFSINFVIYRNWTIDPDNWFLLFIKTIVIFALCMSIYTVFAVLFKIEYVGELIERIRNYIRQKFIR